MKVLYLIVLSLTILDAEGKDDSPCEDGWNSYGDKCYQIQMDYENVWGGVSKCSVLGADVAITEDPKSKMMNFLSKLVATQPIYGSWVLPWTKGWPKRKQFTAPSKGCVGLTSQRDTANLMTSMVGVPCNIKLPYICIGQRRKVPEDRVHYAQHSLSEAYWFSSNSDRLSYDDAKKACQKMALQLVSIRDQAQKNFISHQVRSRSNGNVDPWWIGLDVNNGVYSWSDGSAMQTGILNWDPYVNYNHNGTIPDATHCGLLLYDQTWELRLCRTSRAPFICMKPQKSQGEKGCPYKWVRHGHSCYHKVINFHYGTYPQIACAKVGSHVLSVDTIDEKQFIMNMTSTNVWVTLNDKKQKGSYVWADGSKPSPSVLTWDDPITGGGGCVGYSRELNYLKRHSCDYIVFVGCQYAAPKGRCVSKNWVPYNGNCYFLPHNSEAYTLRNGTRLDLAVIDTEQLNTCRADLGQYDRSIKVMPLKLDSKELRAKYDALKVSPRGVLLGLGLKFTKRGEPPMWADGTPVDYSIFRNHKQPYNGTQLEPKDCVQMTELGYFLTASCYDNWARTVCEKELPGTGIQVTSYQVTLTLPFVISFLLI